MQTALDSPKVYQLTRELAEYTGESVPEVVARALREQLAREKERPQKASALAKQLLEIGSECASLSVLDNRTPDWGSIDPRENRGGKGS